MKNVFEENYDPTLFDNSREVVFLPFSSLTPIDPIRPTTAEVQAYVTANTLTNLVFKYTQTEVSTDDTVAVFNVNKDGQVDKLTPTPGSNVTSLIPFGLYETAEEDAIGATRSTTVPADYSAQTATPLALDGAEWLVKPLISPAADISTGFAFHTAIQNGWIEIVGQDVPATSQASRRLAPVLDTTAIQAIVNPLDFSIVKTLTPTLSEWIFVLGKTPTGTDLGDINATGAWERQATISNEEALELVLSTNQDLDVFIADTVSYPAGHSLSFVTTAAVVLSYTGNLTLVKDGVLTVETTAINLPAGVRGTLGKLNNGEYYLSWNVSALSEYDNASEWTANTDYTTGEIFYYTPTQTNAISLNGIELVQNTKYFGSYLVGKTSNATLTLGEIALIENVNPSSGGGLKQQGTLPASITEQGIYTSTAATVSTLYAATGSQDRVIIISTLAGNETKVQPGEKLDSTVDSSYTSAGPDEIIEFIDSGVGNWSKRVTVNNTDWEQWINDAGTIKNGLGVILNNDLTLGYESGSITKVSGTVTTKFPLTSLAGATWDDMSSDGTIIRAAQTSIDLSEYENLGVVTTLPAGNDAAFHEFFINTDGNLVRLIGQQFYSSITTARQTFFSEKKVIPAALIGYVKIFGIIARKDASSLQNTTVYPVYTSKWSENIQAAGIEGAGTDLLDTWRNTADPDYATDGSISYQNLDEWAVEKRGWVDSTTPAFDFNTLGLTSPYSIIAFDTTATLANTPLSHTTGMAGFATISVAGTSGKAIGFFDKHNSQLGLGIWTREMSGGVWGPWIKSTEDNWLETDAIVGTLTVPLGSRVILANGKDISLSVIARTTVEAVRVVPRADWSTCNIIQASEAGWTIQGQPKSGTEEAVFIPNHTSSVWENKQTIATAPEKEIIIADATELLYESGVVNRLFNAGTHTRPASMVAGDILSISVHPGESSTVTGIGAIANTHLTDILFQSYLLSSTGPDVWLLYSSSDTSVSIRRYTADGAISDEDQHAIFEVGAFNMTISTTTTDRKIAFYRSSAFNVNIFDQDGKEFTVKDPANEALTITTTDQTAVINQALTMATMTNNGAGWDIATGDTTVPSIDVASETLLGSEVATSGGGTVTLNKSLAGIKADHKYVRLIGVADRFGDPRPVDQIVRTDILIGGHTFDLETGGGSTIVRFVWNDNGAAVATLSNSSTAAGTQNIQVIGIG